MRYARTPCRFALVVVFATTGCTRNYYYGNSPLVCDPPGMVVSSAPAVAYGSVCDVPTQVGGGTPVLADARVEPIVTRTRPPRQLVSEPAPVRTASAPAWRGRNDTGPASTRISGAYDDELTIR